MLCLRVFWGIDEWDSDLQASGELLQYGSISSTWSDSVTYALGYIPKPVQIEVGASAPPKRDAPPITGYALIGGRDFIQCSGTQGANLTCPPLSDLANIDPALGVPDDGSEPLAPPRRGVEKRVGGECQFNINLNGRVINSIYSHTVSDTLDEPNFLYLCSN